jgi:hypothetical protein
MLASFGTRKLWPEAIFLTGNKYLYLMTFYYQGFNSCCENLEIACTIIWKKLPPFRWNGTKEYFF